MKHTLKMDLADDGLWLRGLADCALALCWSTTCDYWESLEDLPDGAEVHFEVEDTDPKDNEAVRFEAWTSADGRVYFRAEILMDSVGVWLFKRFGEEHPATTAERTFDLWVTPWVVA